MAGVTYSNRLEDQAAATAINAHQEEKRRPSVLDEDGKLSSASAALSLKYANAQDLPSFPSAGLKLSSAGAAASLADSNKKPFEHWKPDPIPAANKAALLAKDYEMDPLWQPELSAAGSRAALLAHKDTPSVDIWKSEGSQQGQSAAGQALKATPPNAITERTVGPDARQKALMAATGAMSGSRPRAGSSPAKNANSSNWALMAATSSQRGAPNPRPFASGDPGFEAARIQNMAKNNVNRQLYGSAPPVAIEVEEKNRQDMLRASAVAMAKKMYAIQQTHIDEAAGLRRGDSRAAATSSHRRNLSENSSTAADEVASTGPRYDNLEEAARKLAQERLAKMRDEHAEYRQYYGASSPPPRSRMSLRPRRRASTGGSREDDSDDEEQSRRIRSQMSIFQSKVAEVDKKKQRADRDALLEIAHRNVEAKMAKMDEQVFQDTGKASPAQKELWEQQARERAQKSSDERMQNVGKVHIGGGKYLDQAEVDAIAKARLQPTLDEISETAEKQRARDEEIRLEQQRAQEQAAKERKREAEVKAELKAAQELEKAGARKKKAEEKQASREEAAAEKERLRKEKERARLEKEEKRKSAEVKPGKFDSILKRRNKEEDLVETETTTTTAVIAEPLTTTESNEISVEGDTVHDQVTIPTAVRTGPELSPTRSIKYEETVPATQSAIETTTVTYTAPAPEALASPTKKEGKVKSWFKSLTGASKPHKDESASGEPRTVVSEDVDGARDESIRDVAMAGRETSELYGAESHEERVTSPAREAEIERTETLKSTSISSASSHHVEPVAVRPLSGTEHTAQVGRTGLKAKLLKKVTKSKDEDGQPRESFITATSDDEDYEEAKDKFEDRTSTMPPTVSSAAQPASPRATHDHSKFKEEL